MSRSSSYLISDGPILTHQNYFIFFIFIFYCHCCAFVVVIVCGGDAAADDAGDVAILADVDAS